MSVSKDFSASASNSLHHDTHPAATAKLVDAPHRGNNTATA